jgi:hypothetical protein
VGDPEAGLDQLGRPAPDRILVFDRQDAVEPAFVERVDVVGEVDLPETRDAIPPPAHVPRVFFAGRGPAEEAEAVALRRKRLGVLRVRVRDSIHIGAQRRDRIDPEPEQVRGVEIQEEPELEHPLPQLGRVGEVARVAVRVPPLHDAVLDHQSHAALARVVDERRKDTLGLPQILGDAASRIAADERADGDAAEHRCRVDTGAEMRVVGLALRVVGCEVVVVVRERGQNEPVLVERSANALGLGLVESVRLHVARREGPVAQVRPGGELERLIPIASCPRSDVLEAALGHARGQEAELQVATARESTEGVRLAATSTQRSSRDEVRTASVISAARSPSENIGIPSTAEPLRMPP